MTTTESGAAPGLSGRVLTWLRAGYPTGVPKGDYVALLGLLQRKLTNDEVHQIAGDLAVLAAHGEEITVADVERLINEETLGAPSPVDVSRVSSHLAAGGWPLADAPSDD